MTEAPERIWAFPKADWFNAGASTHRIKAAGAKDVEFVRADLLDEAVKALEECEAEIDAYVRQEYPGDHPVHERYRQRDFSANPARIALAKLRSKP